MVATRSGKGQKPPPSAPKPASQLEKSQDEQIKILQAQLAEARAAQNATQNAQARVVVVRTVTKKAPHLAFKSNYAKVIEDIVRKKAWKFFKYLPENEHQAQILCASILCELKTREEQCVKDVVGLITSPAQELAWIEENRFLIAKKINDRRATVAASMKKAFEEYWAELEKPKNGAPDTRELPKLEEFLKVALRKSGLDDDDKGRELSVLWVDKVLPYASGHSFGFHSDHRHRYPISKCMVDGVPLMTSSTEAFALVAYANYRECWAEHFKLKELYPKGKLQPMPKNKPKEATPDSIAAGHTWVSNSKTIYMHHPRYFGKWTEQVAGAKKEGAWKDEGRDLFNKYVALIDGARAHKRCAKWEDKMLEVLAMDGREDPEQAPKTGPPAKKKRCTSENGRRDNISLTMAASSFGFDLSAYGGDTQNSQPVDAPCVVDLEGVDSDGDFHWTDDENEEEEDEAEEDEEPDATDATPPESVQAV